MKKRKVRNNTINKKITELKDVIINDIKLRMGIDRNQRYVFTPSVEITHYLKISVMDINDAGCIMAFIEQERGWIEYPKSLYNLSIDDLYQIHCSVVNNKFKLEK